MRPRGEHIYVDEEFAKKLKIEKTMRGFKSIVDLTRDLAKDFEKEKCEEKEKKRGGFDFRI